MPIVIAILVSFLLIGCEKIEEKMEGEELFQAIEDGNYLLVKIILNVQPNLVNVRDEYEMTPLMASVSSSERSVDIIEKNQYYQEQMSTIRHQKDIRLFI